MGHLFHIVDVFAEARYAGNALAVVRDAADLDSETMQRIAREFGFSETTFLVSDPAAAEAVRTRIFTPTYELPFAGHPTLGTAWVIREHLAAGRPARVALELGIGRVPVDFEPEPDTSDELAWLTAPPVKLGEKIEPAEIARVLGLAPADLDDALPARHAVAGPSFALVPVRRREALARIRVDLDAYAAFDRGGLTTGVYVFAREAERPENQFRARMFFESAGLREDPATGSATACFGAYLLEHLGSSHRVRIEQGVELGRPSLLHLDARWSDGAAHIRVGGRVIESARGELL